MVGRDRLIEIGQYIDKYGKPDAIEHFGINPTSIRRYYTHYQTMIGANAQIDQTNVTIKKLLDRFTPQELKMIADGRSIDPDAGAKPKISFEGEEFRALFVTDTHWGAKHSPIHYWDLALEESYKEGCTHIFHGGDMIEGMSNRPDHVYSLSHIGFSAQMDLAEEQLDKSELPIFIVSGNHDLWALKAGGLKAVEDVARRLDHVTFLGDDIGVAEINGTKWMLHHGQDGGGSYAISYRPQKIVEAFTGGTKPNVLLTGHDHKHGYFHIRNVQCILGGALCQQSSWMRATRKANFDGFWILKSNIAEGEVRWMENRWYPLYNK